MAPDLQPSDPSAPLLRRWQEEGDLDALNHLLQVEVGVLKHMIHGRVHGRGAGAGSASTSDIAQEAVMGLLKAKKSPSFSDPKALRGYLWRSAWHLLVKKYEKSRKGPLRIELENAEELEAFLRHAPGLRSVDGAERAMAIGFAMNLLSLDDRELIRLVYFEGKDTATAAAAIGLTRGAGAMRLVRARRLLAARLSEWADLIS
jgi:RNA polymerase sigma-70 factor, ECF subfamily